MPIIAMIIVGIIISSSTGSANIGDMPTMIADVAVDKRLEKHPHPCR
ncbi:hypothetical protein NKJ48_25990 [Mesorhizobium sp. M0114]